MSSPEIALAMLLVHLVWSTCHCSVYLENFLQFPNNVMEPHLIESTFWILYRYQRLQVILIVHSLEMLKSSDRLHYHKKSMDQSDNHINNIAITLIISPYINTPAMLIVYLSILTRINICPIMTIVSVVVHYFQMLLHHKTLHNKKRLDHL